MYGNIQILRVGYVDNFVSYNAGPRLRFRHGWNANVSYVAVTGSGNAIQVTALKASIVKWYLFTQK